MKPGDVFHITPGTLHRMTGLEDCDILEVSTPELDDVVRLEDRYGRAGTSTSPDEGRSVRLRAPAWPPATSATCGRIASSSTGL